MSRASEYFVELSLLGPGFSELKLYVATCVYVTKVSDDPQLKTFDNTLMDPGDYDEHLFASGKTVGRSEISFGNIRIANTDGRYDDYTIPFDQPGGYSFAGQLYRMWRLPHPQAPWTEAELIQTGTIERLDASSAFLSLDFPIRDIRRELEKPLLTDRYAGTTTGGGATVEGNEELKDQIKPRIYGKVFNVSAPEANPYDRIFEFTDQGFVSIAVRDGGSPLISSGNFANVSALQTALTTGTAIRPGMYGTIVSHGYVGVRAASTAITADVTERANPYAGTLAQAVLEDAGFTTDQIDEASFTALDAAVPYELGIMVDDERNTSDVLTAILQSVGGWVKPTALGTFEVGRFTGPGTPVGEINYEAILTDGGQDTLRFIDCPDTDGHPVYELTLKWKPIGLVQDKAALNSCVSDADRATWGQEWRQIVKKNTGLFNSNPYAAKMEVETLLANSADAEAEAQRLLDLYEVVRRVVIIGLRFEDDIYQLNDTITLTLPRLDFEDGKDMVLIGKSYRRTSEKVEYYLWG